MLLIPLVENVFKHGVSTSETSRIEINIRVEQNILSLKTKIRSYGMTKAVTRVLVSPM